MTRDARFGRTPGVHIFVLLFCSDSGLKRHRSLSSSEFGARRFERPLMSCVRIQATSHYLSGAATVMGELGAASPRPAEARASLSGAAHGRTHPSDHVTPAAATIVRPKFRWADPGYRGGPRPSPGLVIVMLENALRLRCTRFAALAAQCISAVGPVCASCGRPDPGGAREGLTGPSRKGLPNLRRAPPARGQSKQRWWQSCRMRGRPPLPATLAGWSERTVL